MSQEGSTLTACEYSVVQYHAQVPCRLNPKSCAQYYAKVATCLHTVEKNHTAMTSSRGRVSETPSDVQVQLC